MRPEYDFSKAKPNPYSRGLKRQITIRIDADTVTYFKSLSAEVGLPYQSLINLFLRDCARTRRKPRLDWSS